MSPRRLAGYPGRCPRPRLRPRPPPQPPCWRATRSVVSWPPACLLLTGALAPPAPGGGAAQRQGREAWRNALLAVTEGSKWPGASLTRGHFNEFTKRLTAQSRALLIQGCGVRVHDTVHYGVDGGAVPPPVIFSRGKPFVSYLVKPSHPHLAGVGMGVALGQLLGYLTLPDTDNLLGGGSAVQRHPRQTFALLHSVCSDAQAAGEAEPLMERLMTPMRLPSGRGDSFMLVGLGFIVCTDHVQPRHGSSPEEPLRDCLWWHQWRAAATAHASWCEHLRVCTASGD